MNLDKFSELARPTLNHQLFNFFWSCLPSLLMRDSLVFSYHNCFDRIRFFGRLRQIGETFTFFYQSMRVLFHVLCQPEFPYLHIHPELLIWSLRTLHFSLIFLPSFLKCYVGNDKLPIVSLVLYFHWKVHYILLHFAHLVQMPGLISL